jgi:hypothetical protein
LTANNEHNPDGGTLPFDDAEQYDGPGNTGAIVPIATAKFLEHRGWELEPVDGERALEVLEERSKLAPRIRDIALQQVAPLGVSVRVNKKKILVDGQETEVEVNKVMVEAGDCDKIRNILGLVVMKAKDPIERDLGDGHFEFTFTMHGYNPITRVAVFDVEGTRSTQEGFLRGHQPAERKSTARRMAYQQALRRVVETLSGIRNMSVDEFEATVGWTIPETQYIRYKDGSQGAGTGTFGGGPKAPPDPGFEKARADWWGTVLAHFGGDVDKAREWLTKNASFGDIVVEDIKQITTPKWLGKLKGLFAKLQGGTE